MLTSTETSPCPWDKERLQLIAATPAQEHAVIAMLLEQGMKTLSLMEQNSHESAAWARAAHGLAGSAINLGMHKLAAYCKEGEVGAASAEVRARTVANVRLELQRIATHNHAQKET